jgi:hypothetical protein
MLYCSANLTLHQLAQSGEVAVPNAVGTRWHEGVCTRFLKLSTRKTKAIERLQANGVIKERLERWLDSIMVDGHNAKCASSG